jgi:hypothetical protein
MAKTRGTTFGGSVPSPENPAPKSLGNFGSTKTPPDYTLFGDAEEIANRVATGYRLGGTTPENAVPSFQQIRPGPTGKDANRPDPADFRGDSKFGHSRRYI